MNEKKADGSIESSADSTFKHNHLAETGVF